MFMTIWQIEPTTEGFKATETRSGTYNADVYFKNEPTGRAPITAPSLEELRDVLHAAPIHARFKMKWSPTAPVVEEWMA